jgi:hypothetical protein
VPVKNVGGSYFVSKWWWWQMMTYACFALVWQLSPLRRAHYYLCGGR